MVKDSRAVRLANPAQKLAALVSPSERFVYGDFDGDGSGEAFALLYDKGSLRDSYDTYFFNEESYEELSGPSISVSLSYPWKLDGKELVYDGVAGYSVKDSRVVQVFSWPYELNRAGDSDSQFTVTVKADDAVTMAKDGTNSGSTSKQYWLYWNGERFAEYGGRPLTKEQLAAFTGGADLLHSLDYNGDVGSIYYRDNGIITVNYRPWAGTTEQQDNFFRILSCAGDVLTDVTEEMTKDWPSQNRGTYLSSAFLLSYMGFGDPLSSNVYDIQFASRLPIDVRYDLAAAAPEALKNVATLPVHGMLSILNEGDFDGDGQYELFAVLYPYVLLDPYNHYDGRCIYLFLHADGCTILGNSEFASFSHYVLDATDLFCFTEYHLTAGGLGTHVYTVANSRAVQIAVTGPALTRIGDTNQFYTTTPKIYDATDSGVFTFKDYWLFWDGGRLREYGGLRVSEEQLSRFAYGQAVLDSIKNEGNTIDEIYYRGNGVININYSRREEYNYRYGYKNLLYRDGNITDDTENWLKKEGGGRYLASYLDYSISSERFGVDTAYPASFP
ncbi:MAG: hypothetical protein LBK69_05035 [Syntrophomonadaceae bacterium]|jgi:hypothetical protein|nr:hypothetical protein [Syntrophomonadaceae bacterium]